MTESDRQSVAARLVERKRELEDAGQWMGQREIANRLGAAESAVSQWFSGVHEPERERYRPLAALLGVNEAWLIGGWGPKYPEGGTDLASVGRRPPRKRVGNGD